MLHVSHSVGSNSVTPWTVVYQAPLSRGFPRQEYCSELSFPTPGDLPDLGIKPMSLASPALVGGFFTTGYVGDMLILFFSVLDLISPNLRSS